MRTLVKQLLDNQISRRGFMQELSALGVSLSSAQALFSLVSEANAQEAATEGGAREVTGSGSDILMETLLEAGVKYVFNGAGAGTNRFFDSIVMHPELKNYLATNEGQCVAMAEGYHIASGGDLGVVIIPKAGLGNAAGNVYNALCNRSSLLVITAREAGDISDRQGDLEQVDWEEMMDPFMKWSYRMYDSDRVNEFARRAIKVAQTPPGGPVFLQMNEDLYKQEATTKIIPHEKFKVASAMKPDPDAITKVAEMLVESERPLVTVGHEITKSGAYDEMVELAELLALPVSEGLTGLTDFPNQHPLSLGRYTPFLPQNRDADLYLSIGSQMPENGSYVHRGPPPKTAKVVHFSLEPNLLSLSEPTDMSVVGDVKESVTDLIDAVNSVATKDRLDTIRVARFETIKTFTDEQRQKRITGAQKKWDQAPMTYARITSDLNDLLEDDAIILNEPLIGFEDWMDFGKGGRKERIGVAGPAILGWATGAAIGAKLAQPDRQVVALTGDGSFMFQHSLWGMSRHQVPVITVIYNNHAYNITRAFTWNGNQARAKQDLLNYLGDPDVDFSLIAQGYGVGAEKVKNPDELRPAIERAIEATRNGKPYLLDVEAERWGPGGEFTWHPETSVAAMRTKKV